MKLVRVTLLQDAAVLSSMYPDCDYFRKSIFLSPLFQSFKDEVLAATATSDNPAIRIQEVIPEVGIAIQSLNQQVRAGFSDLRREIETTRTAVNETIGSLSRDLSVTARPLPVPQEETLISARPLPREILTERPYTMNRLITTVPELWDEWKTTVE